MKLYLTPGSSSMATHIALVEAGAEFTTHTMSLGKETKEAAYLAVNAEGKVPALEVDGVVLTEVAGTMFYVARRFPAAGLLPEGALEQGQVVSWMSFLASSVHPAWKVSEEHARAIWAIAEQRLGSKEWLVGGRFSIADIHLFRLFWRFRDRLGLDAATYPHLTAHHDRMLARPAVRKVIAAEGLS